MGRMTIMVVDDQADFREVLSAYLEDDGYAVIQASDGVEALEKVKMAKPDIILLDIVMPRLDGYDVCRTLKADPATSDIPIVFLSAQTTLSDKLTGYVSGGHRYLCKPFDMADLDDCLLSARQTTLPGGGRAARSAV